MRSKQIYNHINKKMQKLRKAFKSLRKGSSAEQIRDLLLNIEDRYALVDYFLAYDDLTLNKWLVFLLSHVLMLYPSLLVSYDRGSLMVR